VIPTVDWFQKQIEAYLDYTGGQIRSVSELAEHLHGNLVQVEVAANHRVLLTCEHGVEMHATKSCPQCDATYPG
jgi:hypothetical protein